MSTTKIHLTALPPQVKRGETAISGNIISVEDARDLALSTRRRPWSGDSQVIHITAAHRVRSDVWNSLLKVLEEPPSYVQFHLYAPSTDSIPRTVRSRSHVTRESLHSPIPEDASRLVRLYENGDAIAIMREGDRNNDYSDAAASIEGLWVYGVETGRIDTAVLSEYYLGLLNRGGSPRVMVKTLLLQLALRHRMSVSG